MVVATRIQQDFGWHSSRWNLQKGGRCPDPGLMSVVRGWDTYSRYRNCTLLNHHSAMS